MQAIPLIFLIICAHTCLLSCALADDVEVWVTSGFESFSQGTFDASGENLYVSKRGRLQMIKVWDINHDGHIDLYFGHAHDIVEYQPALIYYQRDGTLNPEAVTRLPSRHSPSQCVSDLNGDGYLDVVMINNMYVPDPVFRSFIYWGGPEGLTPKYRTGLPTFGARQAFAADLNGDGLQEVIVRNAARHRFDLNGACISIHWQTRNGVFPPDRRDDIVIPSLGTADMADVDADGFADLIFHGRAAPNRLTPAAVPILEAIGSNAETDDNVYLLPGKDGGFGPPQPLAVTGDRSGRMQLVNLDGIYHLAMLTNKSIDLYPFSRKTITKPVQIGYPEASGRRVATSDIDRDGIEDLVCMGTGKVTCFWGSTHGYDPQRAVHFNIAAAQDVAVGDVTGDGLPDIAVAVHRTGNSYAAQSRVYVNSKNGLDEIRFIELPTSGATQVHIADLDHDGANDVIFTCEMGGRASLNPPVRVYLGSRDGDYEVGRHIDLPAVSAAGGAMADFNDDGYVDLFVANLYEGMSREGQQSPIYLGGPDGLCADRRWELPTEFVHIAATADVNQDGYLDLVLGAAASGGTTRVWLGGPDGFSAERTQPIPLGPVDGLHIADVDRNGYVDIIYVAFQSNETFIVPGDRHGFHPDRKIALPMPLGGAGVDMADLDGNGWLDLVLTGWSDPRKGFASTRVPSYIWWGSPRGFEAARRTEFATLPGVAHDVAIADLNRDGHLEIVCSNYARGESRIFDSYVFWGNSDRAYSLENMTRLRQASALGIQIADLNHDGWPDISFSNHSNGGDHRTQSRIHWNRNGHFGDDDVTLLPTVGPHQSITSDLGNAYTRKLQETYVSAAFARPPQRRFRTLRWRAETPFGSSVVFQIRTAASRGQLDAANWVGPDGHGSHFTQSGQDLPQLPGNERWIQYRAILRTPNGASTPILTRVDVVY